MLSFLVLFHLTWLRKSNCGDCRDDIGTEADGARGVSGTDIIEFCVRFEEPIAFGCDIAAFGVEIG